MPLIVSKDEWEAAEAYFKANPNENFFPKPDRSLHSFIKIEETIYALPRQKVKEEGILGEGGEGIVKEAINKAGKSIVVKRVRALLPPDSPALLIMKKIGIFIGQCLRLGTEKKATKCYLLLELAQGIPLQDRLTELLKDESSAEKNIYLMVIRSATELYKLHLENIIHGDVKPQNIIVDNALNVKYIDYNFSNIIPAKKNFIIASPCGTKGWAAPELSLGKYSFASDVYALGRTLTWMNMKDKFKEEMVAEEDYERIKLPEVISELIQVISQEKHHPAAEKTLSDARELIAPFFLKKLAQGMTLEELCKHSVLHVVLSQEQRGKIVIACCKIVEEYHKQNKIIIDMSPMNFEITFTGDSANIELLSVYSVRQLASSKHVLDYHFIEDNDLTNSYIAPESHLPKGQFSLASDIYSLGKIAEILGYPHGGMTDPNPENRISIAQAIQDFNSRLYTFPKTPMLTDSCSFGTLSTSSTVSEDENEEFIEGMQRLSLEPKR